jgi:hypothetical protein
MANPISSSGVINGQIVYAEQVLEISHALNGTGSNSIIILGDVIQGSLDNLTDNTSSFAHGYQTTASGLYSHAEGQSTYASGAYSHAEGFDTYAYQDYSHAEGGNSIANGYGSHAEGTSTANGEGAHSEGYYTQANGDYSHAEGFYAISSTIYSHAEGDSTLTLGTASHAEGYLSSASGDYSHAEGQNTLALGIGAHAEGYLTIASGSFSHVEGLGTYTSASYQSAVGRYNVINNTTDYFVVGVGTIGTRANGLGVNASRTYISNSVYLPNLTNTAQTNVVTFNSSGQLFYAASESIRVTNAATASFITASNVWGPHGTSSILSASYAISASFITASNVYGPHGTSSILSASYAISASRTISSSYALSSSNAISSSYALTASYVPGAGLVGNSLSQGTGVTAFTFNGSSAQTVAVSGASSLSSNRLSKWTGAAFANSSLTDNGTTITGTTSIQLSGANSSLTGSLRGTSSWAETASNATTASYVNGSIFTSTNPALTASYTLSSSYASNANQLNGQTSSYYLNASNINAGTLGNTYLPSQINVTGVTASFNGTLTGSLLGTSSWANNALTASSLPVGTYQITASWAISASRAVSASHAISASQAITSSYALTASYINLVAGPGININYQSSNIAISSSGISSAFPYSGSGVITGSLLISGSGLTVTGSINGNLTGSVLGTSSWANNVVFPNVAKTNIISTDTFFIQDSSTPSTPNKYITYSDLLTDLAGTNLVIEANDSLTLSSTITGLTSVSSTSFTGSLSGSLNGIAATASYISTIKSGAVNAGSFVLSAGAGSDRVATITLNTPYANTNYAISVVGLSDARIWTIQNKLSGSFRINSNSNSPLTSEVYWITTPYNN